MHTNSIYSPLEVYVDYESLPATQVALMLTSLSILYALLLPDNFRPELYQRFLYSDLNKPPHFIHRGSQHSTLCLEQAQTGSSITFRFAGRKQRTGINWKGSDSELILPAWSATAVGVGALLLGGTEIYSKYLDAQYKTTQTEVQLKSIELTNAQIEKTRAETQAIISKIKRSEIREPSGPNERRLMAIQREIESFHHVINEQNICKVNINGIPLEKASSQNDRK